MNLRESLDHWDDSFDDPMTGREDFLYACAWVNGFAKATGRRMAVSTGASRMRIHDLDRDTRSAAIVRKHLTTSRLVIVALIAQLDALPFWETELDTWGPDPWGEDSGDEPPRLIRE